MLMEACRVRAPVVPELPEVEVVRRGVHRWVRRRTFSSVDVWLERSVRRTTLPLPPTLAGRSVTGVERRGKFLWLTLDDSDVALVAHLGMSGQLLVRPHESEHERHLRIRFTFVDGGRELRFVDQRTFGWMGVEPLTRDSLGRWIPMSVAHIAPDPFDRAYDPDTVIGRLRSRQTEIKRALLDQTLVSGVGNIYADEALWRAGLHGRRSTGSLSAPAVRDLLEQVRDVMEEALRQGGTSFDALYVNVNGRSGYFDRSLNAYGREGEPCARCGTRIRRESFMNRSSFSCPTCQPAPRATSSASRPRRRRPGG